MNPLIVSLIGAVLIWMALCGYAGFRHRVILFIGVMLAGLALNQTWMFYGLNARPLEINAITAQFSLTLYGAVAFGIGYLASRIARAWVESRVEEGDV